jgi:hypothetical protein
MVDGEHGSFISSIQAARKRSLLECATVYLAAAREPQGFTKLVVLKELRPDLAQDAELRSMFLDEASHRRSSQPSQRRSDVRGR